MKKILAAVLLLCASVCAYGQGATLLFPSAVNSQGGFLSFATITFCTTPTTVNTLGVCQTPVTVFKDQALTQPYSSAIQTDGIGYFPPNAITATSLWFSPAANLCYTLTTSNILSPATNPCVPFSVGVQLNSGSLSFPGNLTQTQPTNATALANQSSFFDCMNASYWTGAISATDQWCLQDVLGTGANPTSTFTLTHGGSPGSSGLATFAVPALSVSGAATAKSDNSVQMANIFATGGTGLVGSPWTSASGTGGIQEAITATGTTLGSIKIPAGFYNITTCINATANSATGFGTSSAVNPLILEGDGKGKTFLVGNTGNCVIDGTGRGALVIKNLTITQGSSSKSTVGIYLARTTLAQSQFSQFNVIENVYCELPTIPTANTNHGTVCAYDFAAEGARFINDEFNGDNPLVLTGDNTFAITSAYQTVLTSIPDMTQSVISGGQYTAEGINTAQAILVQGISDNSRFENVTTEYIGATVIPAFRITPQVTSPGVPIRNLTIENLQAESPAGQAAQAIITSAILQGSNITGNVGTAAGGPPIIKLVGANGQLLNSTINLVPGNAGVTTPLVGDSGVASAGLSGGITLLNQGESISLAVSTCAQIDVRAHFSGPTVTCNGGFNGVVAADTYTRNVGSYTVASSGTVGITSNGSLAIGTTGASVIEFETNSTNRWLINSSGVFGTNADNTYDFGVGGARPRDINAGRDFIMGSSLRAPTNILLSTTAPTIAAGGCGGAAASIATNNGTAAFSVNVGTTPTTACTITMPTAANAWNCYATDITTNSTTVFLQKQTATGASSVTITNFNDVAVAANFTASDIMQVSCFAR